MVPTYSSGYRGGNYGSGYYSSGYYGSGYYGSRHYYGNRHYYGGRHHGHHHYGWSCGWGWAWGWGISAAWCAPYWGGYVSFGYPYYGYSWGWRYRYPWRYPYYVYYPYYRSHVYIAYPYDYVSYYYDPPYYTYYSDGAYVSTVGSADAYASDEELVLPDESAQGVARQVIRPRPETDAEVGETIAGSSDFLAQLKPAQFNFAMGLLHFEEGQYKEANEYFYVASLEDPDSDILKLFLAVSLFSIGEYHFSAEYLRLTMDDWKAFLLYDWDLRQLYRQAADFDAQKRLLEEEVDLHASDRDSRFLLAFVQYHSGDLDAAGRNWEALEDVAAGDPLDEKLVRRYLVALNVRRGLQAGQAEKGEGAVPDLAVARFLSEPSVRDVPTLPIR